VRLRRRLFLEQLPGLVSVAARRAGEDLTQTWHRAQTTPTTLAGPSRPGEDRDMRI
jgi:hypothetical protein